MNLFLKSAFFNVFLFSFFWALQIFVAKLAFIRGAEIVPFTIQSAVVALVVLFLYVLPQKWHDLRSIKSRVLLGLLAANAIHFGVGGFLGSAGTALTSAINAGFLVQFSTVTTSILAWTILKEKATIPRAFMVILILLGSFFLTTNGQLMLPHTGDVLIILACLSWSIGNIIVKKVLKETSVNSDVVSFLRPVAGLPVFFVFLLFTPLYPTPVQTIFQQNIFIYKEVLLMILNGVFTAFVWIFLNRTLKIATASYMTMMSSLTPVIVAILAITFLRETVGAVQLIGILLIISSSIVVHYLRVDKN